MKSLLDPTFVYVPSHTTNIRATFARVKEKREKETARAKAGLANVQPIVRKAAK